jgi:hypothetical protein
MYCNFAEACHEGYSQVLFESILEASERLRAALCEDPQGFGIGPKLGSNRESIIDDVNGSKKGRICGNLMT